MSHSCKSFNIENGYSRFLYKCVGSYFTQRIKYSINCSILL